MEVRQREHAVHQVAQQVWGDLRGDSAASVLQPQVLKPALRVRGQEAPPDGNGDGVAPRNEDVNLWTCWLLLWCGYVCLVRVCIARGAFIDLVVLCDAAE